MYVYYVVYEMFNEINCIGKGCCISLVKGKIRDDNTIKEIRNRIIEDNKEKYPDLIGVLITNFILLRKEKNNE